MRIGVVWEDGVSASNYRTAGPGEAMQRRGHAVFGAPAGDGRVDVDAFSDCDVLLVYRRNDEHTRAGVAELVERGVGLVYDNDDDMLAVMEDHPTLGRLDGAERQRIFGRTVEMARMATVMIATTEPVADRYREQGIERVEVIPNYLRYGTPGPPRPHEGIIVGWVAGVEHVADAEALEIPDALEWLVGRHADVHVECIGVDLGLSERYGFDAFVPWEHLSDRIAGWDIGLAPLEDVPFNRARSDIKVKEYAARGVPWLASPVGPYLGLGEDEGGRLVPDDGWPKALDRLVRKGRERRRLSAAAAAWARSQTIRAVAERYERLLAEVAAASSARAA